ncbi:MAG: LicD family protein [Treponema sp.]|nr:LicD family protein [Treponema sp.]
MAVDIKKVQNRLLEMAKVITKIFEDNNLPYQIAFGTLLGAVRHQGFIPWDDDLDFFLFEEDYPRAMEILRNNLPADLFLEYKDSEEKYFHDWAHVKDVNSTAECIHFPQDSLYTHKGISIDLYIMKRIKEKDFAQWRFNKGMEYINKRKSFSFISPEDYQKKEEFFKSRFEKEKVLTGNKELFAYISDVGYQEIENILPLKKYKFEDTEFYGPNNYDAVLKVEYGSYMELPPEKDRLPHYTNVVFK